MVSCKEIAAPMNHKDHNGTLFQEKANESTTGVPVVIMYYVVQFAKTNLGIKFHKSMLYLRMIKSACIYFS